MTNIFNKTRLYDFKSYYHLYQLGQDNPILYSVFFFFAKYGIVLFFLSFIYLIWKKKISAFFCTFLAMAIAGVIDFFIFVFWQRPRPFITYDELIQTNHSGLNVNASSFPSSHVYVAFAIATSVFLYGHKKLGITLFFVALFVAISRVGSGLHYPSDVIGGALLGVVSGIISYMIFSYWEKKIKEEDNRTE